MFCCMKGLKVKDGLFLNSSSQIVWNVCANVCCLFGRKASAGQLSLCHGEKLSFAVGGGEPGKIQNVAHHYKWRIHHFYVERRWNQWSDQLPRGEGRRGQNLGQVEKSLSTWAVVGFGGFDNRLLVGVLRVLFPSCFFILCHVMPHVFKPTKAGLEFPALSTAT